MLICVFTGFSSGLPLYLLHQPAAGVAALRGRRPEDDRLLRADPAAVHVEVPVVAADRPLRAAACSAGGAAGCWPRRCCCSLSIPVFGLLQPQTRHLDDRLPVDGGRVLLARARTSCSTRSAARSCPTPSSASATSIHVNAYRISSLVPGSLALILADRLPWSSVFLITALFMLPGIVMTLVVDEPALATGAAADAARGRRRAVPRVHRARRLEGTRCSCCCSSSSTSSATAWPPRSPRRSTSTWASPRPTSA